jgi:hypothetical protein
VADIMVDIPIGKGKKQRNAFVFLMLLQGQERAQRENTRWFLFFSWLFFCSQSSNIT